MLAINSARIGNPERAIYHLTNFGYWKFDDAGFAHRSGPSKSSGPGIPSIEQTPLTGWINRPVTAALLPWGG